LNRQRRAKGQTLFHPVRLRDRLVVSRGRLLTPRGRLVTPIDRLLPPRGRLVGPGGRPVAPGHVSASGGALDGDRPWAQFNVNFGVSGGGGGGAMITSVVEGTPAKIAA
jgi:hypothetical protein